MQFPGMPQMQFAPAVSLIDRLKQLGATAQPMAKAAGAALGAPPTAGTPMNINPAATNAGTNIPQPGLMDALKGMSPQSILERLRSMSAGGQQPMGLPGSAALDSAGMLSGPLAASGIPLNLMPGG